MRGAGSYDGCQYLCLHRRPGGLRHCQGADRPGGPDLGRQHAACRHEAGGLPGAGAAPDRGASAGGDFGDADGVRRSAGDHPGGHHQPGPVRHRTDGDSHPPALPGDPDISGEIRPIPPGGHGLVLQVQPGYGLHPPLPHRQGREVGGPHGVRRPGHYHQPLQAGEGPQGHRCRQGGPPERLPQVPALPGERGLRRTDEPPRPAEPPDHPRHHRREGLVFSVLPLCLLQRALHRVQRGTHPHEDRPLHLPQAAGFHQTVSPLLRGLQRGPAHCGRLYFEP